VIWIDGDRQFGVPVNRYIDATGSILQERRRAANPTAWRKPKHSLDPSLVIDPCDDSTF
jgi:hypothetical protein